MPPETDNIKTADIATVAGFNSFSAGDIWSDVRAARMAGGQQAGSGQPGGRSSSDGLGQGASSGGGMPGGRSSADGPGEGSGQPGGGGGRVGDGQAGGAHGESGGAVEGSGAGQAGHAGGGQGANIDGHTPIFPTGGNPDMGTAALWRFAHPAKLASIDPDANGDFPPSLIKSKSENWTVAIDLAASLPGNKDNPIGNGVDRQLAQLKALASETEGKSVNIVVHAQRPVDADNQPCYKENGDASQIAACTSDATGAFMASTERYFIHDGKIDRLPDEIYFDGANDITSLLKDATKLAPSQKVGLVIQSHGSGSDGIYTNSGPTSLDQTIDAIQWGLDGSGHSKLDLLDYDSCDMAEAKVIGASSQAANDVVASSATENATITNDAQNLPAAMRALLADSNMTGRQFGDSIVQQAQEGHNGLGKYNGTQTLANFDLTNYERFNQSLNSFGSALSESSKVPGNSKQVEADIDRTTVPFTGRTAMNANNRDLKGFVQNVLDDTQAGKFSGETKPLADSAANLLKSYDAMVTSTFGEPEKGYDKLGGMTAFLPGKEVLDLKTIERNDSQLHRMSIGINNLVNANLELSSKDSITAGYTKSIANLQPELKKQFPHEIVELKAANAAIGKTENADDYHTALKHMQEVVQKLDNGPMGKKAAELLKYRSMREQQSFFEKPIEQVGTDWDNFVVSRYPGSP